jgi:hypothetical protein
MEMLSQEHEEKIFLDTPFPNWKNKNTHSYLIIARTHWKKISPWDATLVHSSHLPN